MHNPQALKYADFCRECPLMKLPAFLGIEPFMNGANCLRIYLIRFTRQAIQQLDEEASWLMVQSLTNKECPKCGKGCTVAPGLFEINTGIREPGITVIIEEDETSALRYK